MHATLTVVFLSLPGRSTQRTFFFQKTVHMYVFEEMFEGKKLHETINATHENPKYLPGTRRA